MIIITDYYNYHIYIYIYTHTHIDTGQCSPRRDEALKVAFARRGGHVSRHISLSLYIYIERER